MSKSKILDEMISSLHGLIEAETNSKRGLSSGSLIQWSTDQIRSVEDLRDLSDPFWKKTLQVLQRNLDYQWNLVTYDYSDSEEIRSRGENAKKKLLKDLINLAKQVSDY